MTTEESKSETKAIEDLSFEEALAQLDETVDALESGSLTLAQSMAMYERGMKLARVCNEMLTSAEMRITRIRTAYGEQMRMVDGDEQMEVGS